MSVARQHKRYPALALENDWQGRAEIRMTIGADGSIASLVVRASSGHALLDQQALEMVEAAKTGARFPGSLRGREFSVDIPVEFRLGDGGG